MKRLFIIEGIDGSGKTTQVSLLRQKLQDAGKSVFQIKLPNYGSPACAPVEQYLSGAYGAEADSVNAYAASAFFAVDRFAYYKTVWGAEYDKGTVILSDRYVSSNLLHQCAKLPEDQRKEYMEWLNNFEYDKMGCPRPDAVFCLDVPPKVTGDLMTGRYEGDESKKDIHERDQAYLRRCYEMGLYCCENLGFHRITCLDEEGNMLPKEVISDQIFRKIEHLL
ncbi:MAG: deoxynucleoside kinase [Clostridia bacterium]|nr:deoxynucleoside kinase [Clostridia bacterium]